MNPAVLAAIITGTCVIIAAIINALAQWLARRINAYRQRIDSDADWFHDLARSKNVIFIGISHTSLRTYLQQLLDLVTQSSPLHSIQIVYASLYNGKMWEEEAYVENIRKSRQEIAAFVCTSEWHRRFSSFESVSFLQSTHVLTFGGSAMAIEEGRWRVIYVVHYLPIQTPDAKNTLTFKYKSYPAAWFHKKQNKFMVLYSSAFETVKRESQGLGTFKRSLWDDSVQAWRAFSRNCQAHQSSMRRLVECAEFKGDESVLDLASGTGDVSKLILEAHPGIELTVLDASPTMIQACKATLGNRARYALCRVSPAVNDAPIDLEGLLYDAITIHLAIPALAATVDDLSWLARWCKRYLKPQGQVLLALHNTAVNIQSSPFSLDRDPLRAAIRQQLDQMGMVEAYRPPSNTRFSPTDVEVAFANSGYQCTARAEHSFPMTMRDRLLMWSAPAV